MSAPLVVTPTPGACVIDCPVMVMPDPVLVVLARLALSAIAPPCTVMGPATDTAAAMVMLAVLFDLPMVSAVSVEPKFQPEVLKALVKLAASGSIRKTPVPANDLLVGALFCKTSVPALIDVVPL